MPKGSRPAALSFCYRIADQKTTHESHGGQFRSRQPVCRWASGTSIYWDSPHVPSTYHRLSLASSPLPSPLEGCWLPLVTVTVRKGRKQLRASSSEHHDTSGSPTCPVPCMQGQARRVQAQCLPTQASACLEPKPWDSLHHLTRFSAEWMPFLKVRIIIMRTLMIVRMSMLLCVSFNQNDSALALISNVLQYPGTLLTFVTASHHYQHVQFTVNIRSFSCVISNSLKPFIY